MQNTDFRINLAQTQLETIEKKLNRLIEHRNTIMDEVTLNDFSTQTLFTPTLFTEQPSEEEILELTPQVKESVIEKRTLEAAYRQSLLNFEADLTHLIQQYSNLRDKCSNLRDTIKSELAHKNDTGFSVIMSNGEKIMETYAINTFIKVINKLGIERVKKLEYIVVKTRDLPLISDYKDPKFAQKRVGQYWIGSGMDNKDKKIILDWIAKELGEKMEVINNPQQ